MTQIPQGWYPDPAPAQPGQPPMLRFWDGRVWTEHTAPAVGQQPAPTPQPIPQPTYAAAPVPVTPTVAQTGPTTPDGARLAGWWWRVGAYVIDGFALGAMSQVVSIPATIGLQSDFTDLTEKWEVPLENAETWEDIQPFFDELFDVITDHLFWLVLPSMILSLVYFVGLWRWKGATLGQLALGLKVRHPDHDEASLPLGRGVVRWLVLTGVVSIGATVALAGGFAIFLLVAGVASLASFANLLWPLWDKRRQALHDKAANTVVVKIR